MTREGMLALRLATTSDKSMYKDGRGSRIACGNIERRVCSRGVYDGSESSKGLLVLVDS